MSGYYYHHQPRRCPTCGKQVLLGDFSHIHEPSLSTTVKVGSPPTHRFPVGTQVRFINGNTTKPQWGTVLQHLVNGEYLVENTWLLHDPANENHPTTYRYCKESMLVARAAQLTLNDLEVGDGVRYLNEVNSLTATWTVVAKTPTQVVLTHNFNGSKTERLEKPENLWKAPL